MLSFGTTFPVSHRSKTLKIAGISSADNQPTFTSSQSNTNGMDIAQITLEKSPFLILKPFADTINLLCEPSLCHADCISTVLIPLPGQAVSSSSFEIVTIIQRLPSDRTSVADGSVSSSPVPIARGNALSRWPHSFLSAADGRN